MARCHLFVVTLLVVAGSQAHAQEYALQEDGLEGQSFRMDLSMSLKGKITVQHEGKPREEPLNAQARHDFFERVLAEKDSVAVKTARHYLKAEAVFTDGADKITNAFPADSGLIVAHRHKDQTHVFRVDKPFHQKELELTEHFDTLHLTGLLPAMKVKMGETWRVPIPVAQGLCDFDGLIEHNLTGKLEKVGDDLAEISVNGIAKGIDLGAEVNMLVKARLTFDLKQKRIVSVSWTQSDQREQGPVSPALSADVKVELKREAVDAPMQLSNFALVPVPAGAPPENRLAVNYRDKKGRFALQHARDWHLVGTQEDQVVFRLLDRGDFVAQVTVMPWKKVEAPKKTLTLAEFADLMKDAPAWEQNKVLEQTDKLGMDKGPAIFRVAAEGDLNGVNVVQYFYLLSTDKGEQMIVTFTMTPNQAAKLDARDLTLVRSIRLESMLSKSGE